MQAGAEEAVEAVEAVEAEEADRGEREGELVEVAWQPARVATRRAADSPSVDSSYGEAEAVTAPVAKERDRGRLAPPAPRRGVVFGSVPLNGCWPSWQAALARI
jgi:hypothetical protein